LIHKQTTGGNVVRLIVKEAADYVRLTKSTLDQWRTAGKGPRFIKAGRKVLYDVADLDRWLEAHKQKSTADTPQMRRRRRRYRAGMISQRGQRGEVE
jgi:excisionase family DNA binding protein